MGAVLHHVERLAKSGRADDIHSQGADQTVDVHDRVSGRAGSTGVRELFERDIHTFAHDRLHPSDVADAEHGRDHALADGIRLRVGERQQGRSIGILLAVRHSNHLRREDHEGP